MAAQIQQYSFYMPTRLFFGPGCLEKLGEVELPGKHALICITEDEVMTKLGFTQRVQALLEKGGAKSTVYSNIQPNPTRKSVMEGAKLARESGCDFILGLGGGSSIDCGKAISIMVNHPGDYWDYIQGGSGGRKPLDKSKVLPIICVVTTAGTGTEADPGGVVTKDDEFEKIGILNECLFPKMSFVDAELMLSLPAKLTAYQGFDALFHSCEGYIANISSPISDLFALESIKRAARSLVKAVNEPDNLEARADMAFASTLAGVVQSTSFCTSHHSMQHALSAHHNRLAHGAGLIMLCEAYFSFFVPHIPEMLIEMARAMGVSEDILAHRGAQAFVDKLHELKVACGVDDLKMSDYGIAKDDIPTLAKCAVDTMIGLYGYDRAPISLEDTERIMAASWK